MYILKNAFKCIGRSKGRNILILIIVLAIAVSACIGLSIRQAADNAKNNALEGMSVTATISYDRSSAMKDIMEQGNFEMPSEGEMPEMLGGGFDRSQFSEMMGNASSLTLDEYQSYAEAESVDDFYYTLTLSLNGSDEFLPVSDEEESASDEESTGSNNSDTETKSEDFGGRMPGGFGMGNMKMGAMSDFSIVGYSSDAAMSDFASGGSSSISDGAVFDEGTSELQCIITEELATYNSIEAGDKILLTNPNNEEESYEFTVTGIYTNTQSNTSGFSSMMGATSLDPANSIYTSYTALQSLVELSAESSETMTDEETGREYETGLSGTIEATYVFTDVEDYESFEEEVRALGLSEEYTVSSPDVSAFESSITPLETLSKIAGYFLLVILVIGSIVLVVLNIFNVRERKYEIGVLTAMGMKKGKVAVQFLCEIFAVTLIAVMIGAVIGGVSSVPVTNALLDSQIVQLQTQQEEVSANFGGGNRGGMMGGRGEMPTDIPEDIPDDFMGRAENYITEINSAMNLTVVFQMLGIAILLTLAAGAVSMLFVMRYDPLKILSNRD